MAATKKVITLTEKLNTEKLKRVLLCGNLPTKENEKKTYVFTKLNILFLSTQDNQHITHYSQINAYGRMFCYNGIQGIPKIIRNYICNEYYVDIDMVSAQATILQQLFKVHGLQDDFLDSFLKDKENCINNSILTSKQDMYAIINCCILHSIYQSDTRIIRFHQKIYKIFVPLLKKEYPSLYKCLTSTSDKWNKNGCFLAKYLQDQENNILEFCIHFIEQKNLQIGVLMFDGLMVEKNILINDQLLKDLQIYIEYKTGIPMKFAFKTMETDWKPIIHGEFSWDQNFNKNDAKILFKLGKKHEIYTDLVAYLNNFACRFENPHCYGWRSNINDPYLLRKRIDMKDNFMLDSGNIFNLWIGQQTSKLYKKIIFDPIENNVNNPLYYNSFIQPEYYETTNDINQICPRFFEYLKDVICYSNEELYTWILNWISQIIKYGRTGHAIILLGLKGIGKSMFAKLIGLIVGEKYYVSIDNIDRLSAKFNKSFENALLTAIHEIQVGGAEFHKIQTLIKTLVTEEEILIEPKGIDPYKVNSFNNFIFISNEINPIKITKDNRRFVPIRVSDKYKGKFKYFAQLYREVKKYLPELRYFFRNRTYDYLDNFDLPITNCLAQLQALNKPTIERFIEDKLKEEDVVTWIPDQRKLKAVYRLYLAYRTDIMDANKELNLKYFKAEIENRTKFFFKPKIMIKGIFYKNLLYVPS